MAPRDRAEWLLKDFPDATPDERQAKAALAAIVGDALAAERERCARLAESYGAEFWPAPRARQAVAAGIREGREP
jgi:hypothetical protein